MSCVLDLLARSVALIWQNIKTNNNNIDNSTLFELSLEFNFDFNSSFDSIVGRQLIESLVL